MTTYAIVVLIMVSWLTRNAADHARGTARTRCIASCTPDCATRAGTFVMILSVVSIKLSRRSTKLVSAEDNWWCQLCIYQTYVKWRYPKRRLQVPHLGPYQIGGDMSLCTTLVHCPAQAVENRCYLCHEELWWRFRQISWIRERRVLRLTSITLTKSIISVTLTSRYAQNFFNTIFEPPRNNIGRRDT